MRVVSLIKFLLQSSDTYNSGSLSKKAIKTALKHYSNATKTKKAQKIRKMQTFIYITRYFSTVYTREDFTVV